MVISLLNKFHGLFFLLTVLAAGCGEAVNMTVLLQSPDGEDPFGQISVLVLTLEQDQPGQSVFEQELDAGFTRFEIPSFSDWGMIRLLVDGFTDDDPRVLLASGASAWVYPQEGQTIQIEVCFCMLETLELGKCECSG